MLEKDPKNRPNIKEVLEHRWIQKYLPNNLEKNPNLSPKNEASLSNSLNNMKKLKKSFIFSFILDSYNLLI